MLKRMCLIIYFKNPKVLKDLKKIGNITYFHKKRRYAVMYVNQEETEKMIERIKQLKYVRNIEESALDQSQYEIEFNVKQKTLTDD